MAYRRLPNTDKARLAAIMKLADLLFDEVSLLKDHQTAIIEFKRSFGELISQREQLVSRRTVLNEDKKGLMKILKLYVSHFFQVFNFAIERGDIPKECREFFKLESNAGVIPSLSKEINIIKWANNIVVGEQKRIDSGVEAISHPSYTRISNLKQATERVLFELKQIKEAYQNCDVEIEKQRNEIDAFIKQVWNEIETQFINEPAIVKRKKAAQYGVVYVE